jgi:hypothetical protein
MLYAQIGKTLEGKAYEGIAVPRTSNVVFGKDEIKSLLLMVINAKTPKAAFKAFRQEYRDEDGPWSSLKDDELYHVLDAITVRHWDIKDLICNDAGIGLMYFDSMITEGILVHFTTRGIPVLPVHDSYIIQAEYKDDLQEVMMEKFHNIMGSRGVEIH